MLCESFKLKCFFFFKCFFWGDLEGVAHPAVLLFKDNSYQSLGTIYSGTKVLCVQG